MEVDYQREQSEILQKHRLHFLKYLDYDLVLESLHAAGIFKEYHIDKVRNENTNYLRRAKFLEVLKGRGTIGFAVFVRALYSSSVDQRHLGELLIQYVHPKDKYHLEDIPSTHCITLEEQSRDKATPQEHPMVETIDNRTHASNLSDDQNTIFLEQKLEELEGLLFKNEPETDGVLDSKYYYVKMGVKPENIEHYPNFTEPKGLAIIFNNEHFETKKQREGTAIDKTNMYRLLYELGYDVEVHQDLPAKEIEERIKMFSQNTDHEKYDSAVVVILSHGEHGYFSGSDDGHVEIKYLLEALSSSSVLLNIPKFVFIQSCRGDLIPYRDESETDGRKIDQIKHFISQLNCFSSEDAQEIKNRIPGEANHLLVAYSTSPGYVSYRHRNKGSWFIQSVCKVFFEYAHNTDIITMMNKVKKLELSTVKDEVAQINLSTHRVKQISEYSSTLRKNFYFFPKLNS